MSPNGFMTFEPRLRVTFHEGNDTTFSVRGICAHYRCHGSYLRLAPRCLQSSVQADNSARHGLLVLQCQCHLQAFLQ